MGDSKTIHSPPGPPRFLELVTRIVSGGQTGVDRAALDWAIAHDLPHGGWCPKGRLAEDGVIDGRYALRETGSDQYSRRTRQNVVDSDGTLILNAAELSDGSLLTQRIARQLAKPCLVIQLESGGEAIPRTLEWLHAHGIAVLNVAGPRESKRPGIYRATRMFLDACAHHGRGQGVFLRPS